MPEKKQKRKAKKPAKAPPKAAPEKTRRKAKRVPIEHKVLEMWNTGHPQGRKAHTTIVPDDQTLAGLRYAAGKDYACTFENVTVQELCERPMYRGIGVKTMANWCTVDGWVEHRREFREQYRKAMQRAIGSQLVQTRLELMKRGEKGLDRLFKKLVPEDEDEMLEPSSLESLANATRQFWNQVIQEKQALADAIMPAPIVQESGEALPMVKPQLSQSEARAAALTIVRMRREQLRAAMGKDEQPKEAQAKEGLVIDGERDGAKVVTDPKD